MAVSDWSEELQQGMLDFMNYYVSNGALENVLEEAQPAVAYADANMDKSGAAQYRQHIGGVFTSVKQLADMPQQPTEFLHQLAYLVNQIDLAKLNALAPKTTTHNRVDAYVNGVDCLKVLLSEINKAERYIHLSVMLFFNDRAGNQVVQALLQALQRGVQVRIMADYGITALGYAKNLSFGDFHSLSEQLIAAGAKLINTFDEHYTDRDWTAKRKELAAAGVPESHLFLEDQVQAAIVTGLNVVNHRKFLVIDGVTSILGSINIGDQYLYETPLHTPITAEVDHHPLGVPSETEQWHDGCVRIQGALALPLNEIFALQWTVLGGDVFDPKDSFYAPETDRRYGEDECTLLSSFPGNPVNLIQQYYLSLIQNVSDETIIVNPYLIDQAFWECLQALDEEQAKWITICNPLEVNDHPTNKSAVRSNMYGPFMKGVTFYDYSHTERFSHWKITYDKRADCFFHGSYNINERSACHDFELGVLVKNKETADKVKTMIEYDLNVSSKITDPNTFFRHPNLHPSTYIHKLTKNFM
ncbi:phospholipase D domain protein [Paenibacillus swuensis]|uniref:Phospholipase D domain protein n=1 Tax=Paenibacillus swuensis TaxID=1178515 RepID=A0A172TNU9_9BACL|nr:phospholipase D domain protein [Paenibacillus swuensis]